MSNIIAKLKQKFTSANSVPISRAMITRNEYLELVVEINEQEAEIEKLKMIIERLEANNETT